MIMIIVYSVKKSFCSSNLLPLKKLLLPCHLTPSAFYTPIKQQKSVDEKKQKTQLEAKASQICYDHMQSYDSRRLSDALRTAGFNVRYKAGRLRIRRLSKAL